MEKEGTRLCTRVKRHALASEKNIAAFPFKKLAVVRMVQLLQTNLASSENFLPNRVSLLFNTFDGLFMCISTLLINSRCI